MLTLGTLSHTAQVNSTFITDPENFPVSPNMFLNLQAADT